MNDKKRKTLLAISKAIEAVLLKVDRENEIFINSFHDLSKEQKKIALKALNEFEKKLQVFFIAQKKDYLKAVKELPKYLKSKETQKRFKTGKRLRVKKADGISEELLDQFADMVTEFIFSNDKRHVEMLEELYAAFAESILPQLAEICARSVEGSKLGPTMTLTDIATKWLENHKIKFAQEVNKTTHAAVIKSLKDTLTGANGVVSSAEDLVQILPDFFGQKGIHRARQNLTGVQDVDLYNQLSREIDNLDSFEHYRARRIARTETISASNAATLEGWRQSEVIGGKQWLCAMTENSREAHKQANGQIVPLDEPFIVGGEKLMHPGDSSLGASAGNVINCRCTMKSVLKYKMRRR